MMIALFVLSSSFEVYDRSKERGMSPQPPTSTTNNQSTVSSNNNPNGSLLLQNNASFGDKSGQSSNAPAIYHNVGNYIKELEISEGQLSSVIKYACRRTQTFD
jgi:hypothetical protein